MGHLRDRDHPGAGDAGAGDHACSSGARALFQHRHLRSAHRRRSRAVPALLLVLLASGGVHHDFAGHGDHLRADPHVLAENDVRVSGSSVFERVAGTARVPGVGPSHVRRRAIAARDGDLLGADVPGRSAFGREGVQLAGDDVQRKYFARNANVLRDLIPCAVRYRRIDRHLPWRAGGGHSSHRYVLRRGALPLRDDGRNRDRVHRRPALLVAEDDGPHVQRELGTLRVRAGVHRLQHDVPDAVLPGQPRHAAPVLQLPRPISTAARVFDVRIVGARHGAVHYGRVPFSVAAQTNGRAG